MASPSRRSKRNNKRNNKQQSRPMSSSGSDESSAPTYVVEEDSRGELVNRRIGVAWPTRVHEVKRYPDHSPGLSPLSSTTEEDRFSTSPYEMLSLAELEAAAAAAAGRGRGRDKRAARSRKSRTSSERSSSATSPQYVSLSSRRASESSGAETDESTAKIDSVVFDTAEELARYQRLFRAAAARAARSDVSVAASSATSVGERDETDRHYIGVRSRRAVDRKLTPGQFFMYHDKPSGGDIPVSIELKIGHMSSSSKTYHFPIQRFASEGESYYAVMQTETDVKMFPSIASLVQHYNKCSLVDPGPCLEPLSLPV